MVSEETARKFAVLNDQIASRGSMLIGLSGGVDSALLAALARGVLGKRTHAVFLDSPLVSRAALSDAARIARDLSLSFEVRCLPDLVDAIRGNPRDRCYHCRKNTSKILKQVAEAKGCAWVADGANCSDLGAHRPGLIAGAEEGILHPFIEAGITKQEIREAAREAVYWFWDRPSDSCLASRIPYGEEITLETLRMVEDAEEYLRMGGIGQVRVRVHAGVGRIEVEPQDIPKIVSMREEISRRFREIGIAYTTLDLEGFRSGSMDEGEYHG